MQKCEKCGKRFNKEDFSKLKFKQEFIGHFTDELDPFNELTICPECFESEKGKEIKEYNTSNKKKNNSENQPVNLGKKAKAISKNNTSN